MSVDTAIETVPDGWRVYTVDMSIEKRASVMLVGKRHRPSEARDMANAVAPTLAEAIKAASGKARNTYRNWSISSEPDGWLHATSSNYDASYEGPEDGWVDNGQKVSAKTRPEIEVEIDLWIEENAA